MSKVQTSGSTNSINIIVKASDFQHASGKNLQYTRKGDSGKNVTYNQCANCGSLMFVEPEAMADVKVIKLGTVDDEDVLQNSRPTAEIYTKHRLQWCPAWSGIPQAETS